MVTVVVCPQDGASSKQRSYALPVVALGILDRLERDGPVIEQAQRAGRKGLKLTFDIKGSNTISQLSFFD